MAAQQGGTISGKIDFPAVGYYFYSANATVPSESLIVQNLTVYAVSVQTHFVNVTNPNADGTYTIEVPDNGLYQIYVNPDSVVDATRGPNKTQIFQYPNHEGTRMYIVDVEGQNVKGADIKGYAPGYYQPPNDLTPQSSTGASTTITYPSATPTATSTPGFLPLVAIAGMIVAAVVLFQRKN